MTPRICWTRAVVEDATQVDVGSLEIDDPYADSIFRAVHRPLPVKKEVAGSATSNASEEDVLREFTAELSSNEPLLLFITGDKGTGKSHLVRWLKSKIGARPTWHVVYIEKRNTSLKQVIERILAGIDSPRAQQLRGELERASSEIQSDAEAIHALLQRLDHLVKFDTATDIKGLPGLDAEELNDLRHQADRLLGDFTFRERLSQPDGPLARIVRLARGNTDPDEAIDEVDLHLDESDFRVDPSYFEDTGVEFQKLVGRVVSNRGLRTEIAALCDFYLPRAKAEVFTGQTTDLLEVFQDVRQEIAKQGKELCLFIEDLVLLHGIDKQLAQALTIPAGRDLCRLRAAIAVTSGYLSSVDTFADRGIHYTLNIDSSAIGAEGLRDFVSRYLNAGRLRKDVLRNLGPADPIPNACSECPVRPACHETFGTSESGYGLYPFNANAVDRLVGLASPNAFRPRQVLREVIRDPLGVAEDEIPNPGVFPSKLFARSLDEVRKNVPSELRAKIRRESTTPEAELSLRAFYATDPLETDDSLEELARFLGVNLTSGVAEHVQQAEPDPTLPAPHSKPPQGDEIERWVNNDIKRLGSSTANSIRKFVCNSVLAELQNGPYGVSIRKVRNNEWRIGNHTLKVTDVDIERSQGGGVEGRSTSHTFKIAASDEDAILIRGILAVNQTGRFDTVDQGRWYFTYQERVRAFARVIADSAARTPAERLQAALLILAVLRHASSTPGSTVAKALTAAFSPVVPPSLNSHISTLLRETRGIREEALLIVRDTITAAKGDGTPSILDVGPVHSYIRGILEERAVSPSGSDEESLHLLRSLSAKQSTAARQAWDEFAKLAERVRSSLAETEDLARLIDAMDKLVSEGHQRGLLPRFDSRTQYQQVRERVDAQMMSKYKRVAASLRNNPSAANLWDLVEDPCPALIALADYARHSRTLLDEMDAKLASSHSEGFSADPALLVNELRGLATELESLAEYAGK